MNLFNTDVLIDLTRGGVQAYSFLNTLGSTPLFVPGPVAMEFLIGSRDKAELQRSLKTLASVQIVYAEFADHRLAVTLVARHCLSTGLSLAEFLIAAQAINRQAILYTFNLKHFGATPGLDACVPYLR